MDYSKIYIDLMERAKFRILKGYKEKHHIIPKCMGGDNKNRNLVDLTLEEHYLAHLLLVKIYPTNNKLICAVQLMSGNAKCSNKLYSWCRKRLSNSRSGKGNHRWGKPSARRGLVMSDEQKKKISESNKGKIISKETLKKMSESQSGQKHSRYGKKLSEETKQKIRESNLGQKRTKEACENMSRSKLGKPAHNKGKCHSEESRKKMSDSHIKRRSKEQPKEDL